MVLVYKLLVIQDLSRLNSMTILQVRQWELDESQNQFIRLCFDLDPSNLRFLDQNRAEDNRFKYKFFPHSQKVTTS